MCIEVKHGPVNKVSLMNISLIAELNFEFTFEIMILTDHII